MIRIYTCIMIKSCKLRFIYLDAVFVTAQCWFLDRNVSKYTEYHH